MTQRELSQLRQYQQEVVANRAMFFQNLKEKRARESSHYRGNSEKTGSASENNDPQGEAAFRMLDLAETEARIIALETQSAMTGLQASFSSRVRSSALCSSADLSTRLFSQASPINF